MLIFIDNRTKELENEIKSLETKRDHRATDQDERIRIQNDITLKYARILELLNVRNEMVNRNRAQENRKS